MSTKLVPRQGPETVKASWQDWSADSKVKAPPARRARLSCFEDPALEAHVIKLMTDYFMIGLLD